MRTADRECSNVNTGFKSCLHLKFIDILSVFSKAYNLSEMFRPEVFFQVEPENN